MRIRHLLINNQKDLLCWAFFWKVLLSVACLKQIQKYYNKALKSKLLKHSFVVQN